MPQIVDLADEGSTPSGHTIITEEDVLQLARKAKVKVVFYGPQFPRWGLWNKHKRVIKRFTFNREIYEFLKERIQTTT